MTAFESLKKLQKRKIKKKEIILFSSLLFISFIIFGIVRIFALDESNWSIGDGGNTTLITGSSDSVVITASEVTLDSDNTWLGLDWNYKKSLEVKNISNIVLPQGDTVTVIVNTSELESVQDDCDDLRVGYVINNSVREIPRDIVLGSGSTSCLDSKDTRVSFKLVKELSNSTVEGYVNGDEVDSNYVLFYGNESVGDTVATEAGEMYLDFDGVDDFIDLGPGVPFTSGQNTLYSLSFWVKPASDFDYAHYKAIIGSLSSAWNTIYFNGPSALRICNTGGNNGCESWVIDPVNDGNWHHFVIEIDSSGSYAAVFQNNINRGSKDFAYYSSTNLKYIGGQSSSSERFKGSIDNVYFYNTLLTEPEVELLYKGFLPTKDMYLGYNFDEGTGQLITDISGNSRDDYLGVNENTETSDPTRIDEGLKVYKIGNIENTLACPLNGNSTCVNGGTPTMQTGAIRYSSGGSALKFDGNDDYIRLPDTLGSSNKWTIEYWAKSPSSFYTANNYGHIFYSESFKIFHIAKSSLRMLELLVDDDVSIQISPVLNDDWMHIAYVLDGESNAEESVKIFVNGLQKVNTAGINNNIRFMDFNEHDFTGDNIKLGDEYYGQIEEVRISNSIRYQGNFTSKYVPFESDGNTVALYHFDENGMDPRLSSIKTDLETALGINGNGVVYDASGNGNHGLVVGAVYTNDTPIGNSGVMSHEGVLLEEGTTNKVLNPSFENDIFDKYWSKGYQNLDLGSSTFTAKMAKRNSEGPFAAGVTVQGIEDNKLDVLSYVRGNYIGDRFYDVGDDNQGSYVFWITPMWDGNDGLRHEITKSSGFGLYKGVDNKLYFSANWNLTYGVDVSSWQAGETHSVVVRWDGDNTLDGINYISISIDGTNYYGDNTLGSVDGATIREIGSYNSQYPLNAIIEGLTIYRRVLYDGTYGTDIGNGNEISQIYNSGVGKDPTEITGSWDVVFCLPTDGSTGELTTTNQAWSMPHSSNLLGTGGFMMSDSADVDGWDNYSSNKIVNDSFESNLDNWNYEQSYILRDEFNDNGPITLVDGVSTLTNNGVITPILGSELVTNGTFDTDLSGWSNLGGYEYETSEWADGTMHLVSISSNTKILYSIPTNIALTNGVWYQASYSQVVNSGSPIKGLVAISSGGTTRAVVGSSAGDNLSTFRSLFTENTIFRLYSPNPALADSNVDNVSVKSLPLASLFSTVSETTVNKVVSTDVTLTPGTQAGVVLNLDNADNPQNFVIAYHDGTNAYLEKNVNGTYTSLINTAATYVEGAEIKVLKKDNVYKLVYNGIQIGSDQTISDASIVDNTLHGLFSTYSGNTFSNFKITTNLDGSLASDGVSERKVVDTLGYLSIENGYARFQRTLSPEIWTNYNLPVIQREVGRMMISSASSIADGQYYYTGFSTGAGIAPFTHSFALQNGGIVYTGAGNVNVGSPATSQDSIIVLRNSGAYYFVKSESYPRWTLMWISPSGTTTNLYPSVGLWRGTDANVDYVSVPEATWLPTPLAYDTFTRADGEIGVSEVTGPDSQITPSLDWTGGVISSGKNIITPELGSELVTNGGFDSDTAWTKTGQWLISDGNANVTATGTSSLSQSILSSGNWYSASVDTSGGPTYEPEVLFGGYFSGNGYGAGGIFTGRAGAGTAIQFNVYNGWYATVDNISVKPLTFSSLFSTISTENTDIVEDINITSIAGTQAGIVTNLDSEIQPTAGILAYLVRVNNSTGAQIRIDKFTSATTWVNLQSTSVTYSPGATLRVITYHSDLNTLKVRVYYNNALVGSEQTITDPEIINNTRHGLFSTYEGNTFDNFSIFARGTDGEYNDIPAEDILAIRSTSVSYDGASSVSLNTGSSNDKFTQTKSLENGYIYDLSVYAYTDGSAVSSSDLVLNYNNENIPTTYTDMGSGWYKLTGTFTGVSGNTEVGVNVMAEKSVYVDKMELSTGISNISSVDIGASEKIFSGGYSVSSDNLGGIYKDIGITTGKDIVIRGIANSDGTSIPRLSVYDVTNDLEIGHLDGSNTSTKDNPDNLLFTAEGTLESKSEGSITLSTNPIDGDMVEIGGITYTFSNDLRNPGVGEILVGTDSVKEKAMENLYNAIVDGDGAGRMYNPNDTVVDSAGNYLVSDSGNDRVVIFNSEGTFIRNIGSFGSSEGLFNEPKGIAIDSAGNLYVADGSNHRIEIFDSSYNYVRQITGVTSPSGVFVDGSGNIYITSVTGNHVRIYTNGGTLVRTFGSAGSADGQFSSPGRIVVDSQGLIYVLDSNNSRLQVFDTEGNFLRSFGSYGTADTQFDKPWGLTIDSADNLYIGDSYNHYVKIFDKEGNFLRKFGGFGSGDGQFTHPWGLSLDSNNNIVVADLKNRIQVFDNDGNFILRAGNYSISDSRTAGAIATEIDSESNIYVLDSTLHRVLVLDNEGNVVRKFGSYGSVGTGVLSSPKDLHLDNEENLIIADTYNHKIKKFDKYGVFISEFGSYGSGNGQFAHPWRIDIDSTGKIYVVEFTNHRVQVFSSDGTYLFKFGSQGSTDGLFLNPTDLVVDSQGYIYVLDSGNDRIQKFDSSGNFISVIGSSGSGDGQFLNPTGIAVDDGNNLYVSDSSRANIQIFNSEGVFQSSFSRSNCQGIDYLNTQLYIPVQYNGVNVYSTLGVYNNVYGNTEKNVWGYTYGTSSASNTDIKVNNYDNTNFDDTTLNLESTTLGLSSNNITLSKIGSSILLSNTTLLGGTDNSSNLRIRLLNSSNTVSNVNWHQVEVYTNLVNNPSFERWDNSSYIPDDWNYMSSIITSEETDVETGDIHSTGKAFKYINTIESNNAIYTSTDVYPVANNFYSLGYFAKNVEGTVRNFSNWNRLIKQSTASTELRLETANLLWDHYSGVGRVVNNLELIGFTASEGVTALVDDVYSVQLSPVSLSLTPSSYEYSQTDDGGVVVNGRDSFSQTLTGIDGSDFTYRFKFIPAYDESYVTKINNDSPYNIFFKLGDDSDAMWLSRNLCYSRLRENAYIDSNISFVEGEEYLIEISHKYPGKQTLKIDGVTIFEDNTTGAFTGENFTLSFGSYGTDRYDGTYYPYPSSTITENTNLSFVKYGTSSTHIVTSTANDEYLTEIDLGNTNNHTISAYVYNNTSGSVGGIVDSNIAQLVFNNNVVSTTYTDEGGGWYRLSYTGAGIIGTTNYGVQVKGSKDVYVDGLQIEEKGYETTYADGSLGTGYSWSGTANESSSGRTASDIVYTTGLAAEPVSNSVSIWFYYDPTVKSGLIRHIHRNMDAPGGNTFVQVDTAARVLFRNVNATNTSATYTFCPNESKKEYAWNHVVTTVDEESDVTKCCLNGVCSNEVSFAGIGTLPKFQSIRISGHDASYAQGNMEKSDLRIYDEVLTEEQILQLYNQGMNVYSTGVSSNGKYAVEGTWTSQVIDLSNNGQWGISPSLLITDNKGSDNIVYQTRTSPDNVNWTNYEGVVINGEGYDFISPPNRYLQVKAILQSSNQSSTPSFSGMSFRYVQDTVKPSVNASNIQYYSSAQGGQLQTPNNWTNIHLPYISWTEGQDNTEGSGLRGYCLYLGQDPNADPALEGGLLSSTSPVHTTETECEFIIDTPYIDLSNTTYHGDIWMSSSNTDYYFKVKAVDYTGNVYGTTVSDSETYIFKLDNTLPLNPKGISAPQEYQREISSFTLYWAETGLSAASDAHSGIKGYQYRIGEDGLWFGTNHTGDQDCQDLLTNTTYTLQEVFEGEEIGDELEIGENVFYVRTWDNICNVTETYATAILQYSADAPSRPTNLTVVPSENSINEFSFDWDIPETFSGQEGGLQYCYTVNIFPSSNSCNWTSFTNLNADAYANQPGENILYVVAMDEAGNINYDDYTGIKFYANTSAPGIVQNLEISDISIKSTSKWKLALAWDQPDETGAGVASYRIYRSDVADSNYSADSSSFDLIGTTSGESYTDVNLQQKEYFYVVKACDSANNCSAASNTVHMLPTGRFYVPAEIVTNPKLTHVSTKSATIAWVTERESDSRIQYGLSSGEYFEEEISNSEQVVEHSLTLNNLEAGTTYYFKTRWTDEDGNTGMTDEMSFKTEPPPSVKDVEETYVNLESAGIRFTTKGASKVKVYYGKDVGLSSSTELETSPVETTYTVTLTGLEDGTKYFYKINLFDIDGNEYDGTVLLDFLTPPKPEITNVEIQEKHGTAQPTMEILWESNTEVNSIVRYYPSGKKDLVQNRVDIEMIKGMHKMELNGLLPTTTYTMTVEGTDKLGNTALSEEYTFTTATDTRPPQIYDLKVDKSVLSSEVQADKSKSGQLIVSWKTDEPSTSQVMYDSGLGDTYQQKTKVETNLKTEHVVIISNLTPSTVYHLQVSSLDSASNEGKGSRMIAVTPKATNTVFEVVVESLSNIFKFLR